MSTHPSTRPDDRGGRVPGSPTAIQTFDLTKVYGDHTALHGLSFDVAEGAIFGLRGPNGAGKSTTIKILTTLSRATSATGRENLVLAARIHGLGSRTARCRTTEVAAGSDLATATETVRRLEPDTDVTTEGRRIRVRVDDGPAAVPRILAALDQARVDVLAITVARPSLDDVYLRHTGRTLAPSAVQEAS